MLSMKSSIANISTLGVSVFTRTLTSLNGKQTKGRGGQTEGEPPILKGLYITMEGSTPSILHKPTP